MKKASLFIFLSSILFLTSCGGLHDRWSIYVKDPISGENFSVKMHVKRAASTSPSMRFTVSKSTAELANEIAESDSSLSTAIHQDRFILIKTASNFFLLDQVEKLDEDRENENRYVFFAPIGTFKKNTSNGTLVVMMYLPYHLLKGIAVQYSPGYKTDYPDKMECDTCGTIDDFINFYSELAYCDIKESDETSIVVQNKIDKYEMKLTFSQEKVTFTILV